MNQRTEIQGEVEFRERKLVSWPIPRTTGGWSLWYEDGDNRTQITNSITKKRIEQKNLRGRCWRDHNSHFWEISLSSYLGMFGRSMTKASRFVRGLAATLKMPHEHHESCGHDHDHDSSEVLGFQDNLFPHIDRPNVVALNANGNPQDLIKPWHTRLDESQVRCMAIHKRTPPT